MSFSEWRKHKLGDITAKIGAGSTPTGGKETYSNDGEFALIRSQNVLDFTFSYHGLAYINKEQAKKLSNVVLEEGDVLLNITGDSVARVCQVPKTLLPARVNQHVAIIRPKELVDNAFLKYYLLNPPTKTFLLNISSVGATRNAITKGMIEGLEISLPPLQTQQRIASILSSLDDKIELNRQTNQTLEAIAQTLFKEMCLPKGDVLEDGWRVGKLGEVLNFKNGKYSPHRDDSFQYPVYGANGIIGFSENYNSKEKSIIIGRVGSYCGAVYFTLNKSYVTDNAIIAESINEHGSMFCFHILQKLNLNNFKVGSGQPLLNQTILSSIEIVIPKTKLIKEFEVLALSFFEKIDFNSKEIKTLTTLRDSLLPKLMKGEIEM